MDQDDSHLVIPTLTDHPHRHRPADLRRRGAAETHAATGMCAPLLFRPQPAPPPRIFTIARTVAGRRVEGRFVIESKRAHEESDDAGDSAPAVMCRPEWLCATSVWFMGHNLGSCAQSASQCVTCLLVGAGKLASLQRPRAHASTHEPLPLHAIARR